MAIPDEPSTEILASSSEDPPRARAATAAPPATAPPALIGRTLGKFALVERLGRGGSGEVFRAEQVQLGRSAVIKVLRREIAQAPNRIERFLREAQLASRLDHPYAAHIYAFGAEPDGVLWIAMEHVRGATLDELVARRGPMPAAVFGPLFQRLCEVVHTAHELGIVHRDIKGSNVMVVERAGQLLPKLLDFGIAKGLDGPHAAPAASAPGAAPDLEHPALTGHGSTLGSPHYMSPEQWAAPADVDARADIYALAVLAYRGVSGRLPFQDVPRSELPAAHLTASPPALSERVPARLAEAIARGLEKAPAARWPTALAFGDAVQRAVGGVIPEAVPIFDPPTRDTWLRGGPQPIADAVAHVAGAATTVEADTALRELVAITCRWLAVIALGQLGGETTATLEIREHARAVVGRDDCGPWLALARAAASGLPGLEVALAQADALAALAARLDDRDRPRTLTALASNIASAADALRMLEPLLAYQLVVGLSGGVAESWQGPRRRDRERVLVWGDPLAEGEVALLDGTGRVVVRLSPLVQVIAPLPSAEPELFLLWRGGRGPARLVAAPWGFERDDDAAGQRLALLTTEEAGTLHDTLDERSPYPGLAAYSSDDADRFVGREREVESLANRLVRAPLLAVLGPSGAGKSSFIHAGVLPRLREQYEIIAMRPGRHPLRALAALPALGVDAEDLDALVARLRALGERAPRGVVIVIDQLEELATLCSDPGERRRFAETLTRAADGPAAPVRVVVTLRDDFATVLESEAAFRGAFEVFVLAAPSPEALRRIVTEPARRAAVTVDPDVVEDMVAEVAGRPASLPLLSFTASQLWQTRDKTRRRITHAAYVALGGVAGALSTYADQIYGSLAKRDQEITRDLFARLVATDGTRIPAPRAELEELAGARAVLGHLIDARLLVVRQEDRDHGLDIVEIVHECLAERWQRLARWRSEDAADRALLADVRTAARRWQDAGRRPDLLWRGEALAELRRLAHGGAGSLTELERAFAHAADRAVRRARRLRRGLVIGALAAMAGVAVVMAYLGAVADRSRTAAETSAGEARAAAKLAEDRLTTSTIAQGKRELNDGRGLAALAYFGEAVRRGADTPGLRFMIGLASRAWKFEKLVVRDQKITTVTLTSEAIIAGDQAGTLRWWTPDARPLGELATDLGDIVTLRVEGDRMMVVARRGILVVDAARRTVLARLATGEPPVGARLGPQPDEMVVVERAAITVYGLDGHRRRTAAFDSSRSDSEPSWGTGARAVFVAQGTALHVVDTVTMRARVLSRGTYAGPTAAIDGSVIGWLDADHVAHLVTADGTPIRTLAPPNTPQFLAISATGDRIAAVSEHAVVVYDDHGAVVRTVPVEPNQTMVVVAGDEIWTGTSTGLVRHYADEILVASLPSHVTEVMDLRISRDLVATIGSDSSLVVIDRGARHVVSTAICERGSYTPQGIAIGHLCEGATSTIVHIGARRIGTIAGDLLDFATLDPGSQRAAISGTTLGVFDPRGAALATSTAHLGPVAFEDADHLLVADYDDEGGAAAKGVWRWTFATDRWEQLDTTEATAIVGVADAGFMFGGENHLIVLRRGGREVHRVDVGDRVDYLTVSANRRWVAATLATGGTVILDGTTGAIARRLAPADAIGVAANLDPAGDLVIRASRGGMTIWDRHTGDELLFNSELLRTAFVATFGADGRIELGGRWSGVLDIAPEVRPLAQILHAIDCRVPLRITAGRLEARALDCR